MKVYTGITFNDRGVQVDTLVAAASKKRARELLKVSPRTFELFWSETVNKHKQDIALRQPETVFKNSRLFKDDYEPHQ